jgi:regulatory protein
MESLVTEIKVQKNSKDRVNLYLDGEYSLSLSAELIVKFGIKVGQSLDIENLKEIINEDNIKLAFNKALLYITRCSKSKKEVKDYLIKRDFDEECVQAVMNKLEGYNFINDNTYAGSFVNSNKSRKAISRKELEYKMKQKGIDSEKIEKAIEENYSYDEEIEACKKLLAKYFQKYSRKEENEYMVKNKTFAALYNKGFNIEIIEKALSIYLEENNE